MDSFAQQERNIDIIAHLDHWWNVTIKLQLQIFDKKILHVYMYIYIFLVYVPLEPISHPFTFPVGVTEEGACWK